MAKCPKCKAEINHLHETVKEVNVYDVYMSGDSLDFDHEELQDWQDVCFRCPECDEIIAEYQDQAIALLKSEVKDATVGTRSN